MNLSYLVVPFEQFEKECLTIIEIGEDLVSNTNVSNTNSVDLDDNVTAWVGRCLKLLSESFADPNNDFLHGFKSARVQKYSFPNIGGTQKSDAVLKKELQQLVNVKIAWLQSTLKFLKFSGYIIDRVNHPSLSSLTTEEKMAILLYRLYILDDGYYHSAHMLFESSGVIVKNLEDIRGMVGVMEKNGFVRSQGGAGYDIAVSITTEGKIYVEKYKSEIMRLLEQPARSRLEQNPKPEIKQVFIVHGHNELMKSTVARFIEHLNLEAIILHEKASKGKTLIEKFSLHSDVHYAIVLLSADDRGFSKNESIDNSKLRARQNVIFELGFFIGKLGRENVHAIFEQLDNFDMPTDFAGVAMTPFDAAGGWKMQLINELKAAGAQLDLSRVFS